MKRIFFVIVVLFSVTAHANVLHVSAPRSVKGALLEISELFEKNHPQWKVKLRIGKSAELGRLIEQATETDIFLLSDDKTIRDLRQKQLIQNVRPFLTDQLVVIGPAASKLVITDPAKLAFPELKGVALFGEKHPIGKTARAYLTKINVLPAIQAKISPKKSTKEVIQGITTDQADWAIVFASDVVHVQGIKVLWKIPEKDVTHDVYYIGSVKNSDQQDAIRMYLETLNSTIAIKIFENAGLTVLKK